MRASLFYRNLIIKYSLNNISYRNIVEILKNEFNFIITLKSVFLIFKKYNNYNTLKDLPGAGIKRLLNDEHLEYLNKLIKNNRKISIFELISKIYKKYNIRVSVSTIRRAAIKCNWKKTTTT